MWDQDIYIYDLSIYKISIYIRDILGSYLYIERRKEEYRIEEY